MPSAEFAALIFVMAALIAHLGATLLALRRCRADRAPRTHGLAGVPVTILRPVRGIDHYDEITLASSFSLAHESYEIIFCCAEPTDPVISLIRKLMSDHPKVSAHLLIGDDRASANPKLNNLIKGWKAAKHDWIVIADSNVLMPPDYLMHLLSGWRADTGLVCSPPVGSRPDGFWAELECAFLNTYQARWQLAADSVGFGFAQGKSMLWRRELLEAAGGIGVLGTEIAEDAAATKIVRAHGLRVRLVDHPFEQPLGRRTAREVWHRQIRWAKLRRATFPFCFLPEVLTGVMPPLAAACVAADSIGLGAGPTTAALVTCWYASEALLAKTAGWRISILSPVAWVVRDVALPALWVAAWLGNSFTWRGNDMTVAGHGDYRRGNALASVS